MLLKCKYYPASRQEKDGNEFIWQIYIEIQTK